MEIKLRGNNECITLVSENDYQELSKYKWYLHSNGYAHGKVNNKMSYMHTYLLKPTDDFVIDHINNNKLDNRRENLRILTSKQNNENSLKRKNTSSKFYGVYFIQNKKKYRATIIHNSKPHYLGYFENEIDAAECRDMYIVHNNINHLKLNFPDKKEIYLDKLFIRPNKQTNKYNYKGVKKDKKKYVACIMINYKRVYICYSVNPLECAKAYDKYIVDNNIQSKQLNFPQDYPNYNRHCITKTFYKEIHNNLIELNDNIIIDKEDYDRIKNYSCYLDRKGYVIFTKENKKIKLHRFVVSVTDPKIFVDHIDNNKINNKKEI